MLLKQVTHTLSLQVQTCTHPVCPYTPLFEHERILKICLSIFNPHLCVQCAVYNLFLSSTALPLIQLLQSFIL